LRARQGPIFDRFSRRRPGVRHLGNSAPN
jgi:hypothetical protein